MSTATDPELDAAIGDLEQLRAALAPSVRSLSDTWEFLEDTAPRAFTPAARVLMRSAAADALAVTDTYLPNAESSLTALRVHPESGTPDHRAAMRTLGGLVRDLRSMRSGALALRRAVQQVGVA